MTPARIEHVEWWDSCTGRHDFLPDLAAIMWCSFSNWKKKKKKLSQLINVGIFFFMMTLLYFHNMLQNMDCPLKAFIPKGPVLPHANSIPSELETVTSLVQL